MLISQDLFPIKCVIFLFLFILRW